MVLICIMYLLTTDTCKTSEILEWTEDMSFYTFSTGIIMVSCLICQTTELFSQILSKQNMTYEKKKKLCFNL